MRCVVICACAAATDRLRQPWAFEAREYLRAAAVGKEITFTSTHSLPPNDETLRDLGTADIGGHDLSVELTKAGWATVKDHKGADEDPRTKCVLRIPYFYAT